MDAARTAVRAGSAETSMYSPESRKEMPASEEEIEEAMEEHISVNNSWGPKRILSGNGKVTGVEFGRCTRVFDENRRFSPQYDEADTIVVPADNVLVTIGKTSGGDLLGNHRRHQPQRHDSGGWPSPTRPCTEGRFLRGDCCTGPKFAIDAIAAGKQAAISIHRFVHPGQSLTIGRDPRSIRSWTKNAVETYDNTPALKPETLDSKTPAEKTPRPRAPSSRRRSRRRRRAARLGA